MYASLVADGTNLFVPKSMGTPADNQLQGLPLERLGELSSRICYDSLGYDEQGKPRGRSSHKLHEHILEVCNHSVYEHCNYTVVFPDTSPWPFIRNFLNRKGVWIEIAPDDKAVEITVNFRTMLEWGRHYSKTNITSDSEWVRVVLLEHAHQLAPMIFPLVPERSLSLARSASFLKTDDLTDDQAWISLYLSGSRGLTHEQVRHRFAISQRSTRYVDEDGSPYIMHPLVKQFLEDPYEEEQAQTLCSDFINASMKADRATYAMLVRNLQAFCIKRGMDKFTARKQARGAARGYLGNALFSEMIFSAPVSGWKWIIKQRKNKLADAEIRELYTTGLSALQSSAYGDRFASFTLVPSSDGLGTVLAY